MRRICGPSCACGHAPSCGNPATHVRHAATWRQPHLSRSMFMEQTHCIHAMSSRSASACQSCRHVAACGGTCSPVVTAVRLFQMILHAAGGTPPLGIDVMAFLVDVRKADCACLSVHAVGPVRLVRAKEHACTILHTRQPCSQTLPPHGGI